jgi:hypothetical protein
MNNWIFVVQKLIWQLFPKRFCTQDSVVIPWSALEDVCYRQSFWGKCQTMVIDHRDHKSRINHFTISQSLFIWARLTMIHDHGMMWPFKDVKISFWSHLVHHRVLVKGSLSEQTTREIHSCISLHHTEQQFLISMDISNHIKIQCLRGGGKAHSISSDEMANRWNWKNSGQLWAVIRVCEDLWEYDFSPQKWNREKEEFKVYRSWNVNKKLDTML